MSVRTPCLRLGLILLTVSGYSHSADVHVVGVGRADITPKHAVRLSGFGFRRTESEGVQQRLWAKAIAIGKDNPAVLVAVDNLGVSTALVEELASRLAKKGVHRDRLAVTATHTHTAPMLTGVCPTLFGVPIPKEHQARIDRYTRTFVDGLEQAVLAALDNRAPGRLHWGVGKLTFASNRRTASGPVDHDLPLLVVRDLKGKLRAVWVNYACHCVTLSHNKVGGDWAGFAQQAIEDDHPGVIALVSIGCGADSNPSSGVTGDKVEIASRQGIELGKEVNRLLAGYLAPVTGSLTTSAQSLELPLADLPTRAEWENRANRKDAVGHHARVQLERLARGEKLRTKIDYRIMTWSFGSSLGLVFLPGEVVVDYSLRLKRELDGQRLWVNAYANDAPCYIPSERILKEGGYEGGGAMIYYDVPTSFRPGLEDRIIATVRDQLGTSFRSPIHPGRTGGSLPQSPQQSLANLRTKPGLVIDLVAAEPLVTSPVAIDFGSDGRLWVAEMFDYPSGLTGDFKPAGRVRLLQDTDGDGIYDKSTIFIDKIPFPTGVTVWRKGVLICSAPDILYAEDTDDDGKADKVEKLYSGFGTDNYQARINSLEVGLDGWLHGSCGLFGGKISCHRTGKVVELGDRDFRIRPDTGEIEPAVGRTQQGRVRDDRGNWFGCDNSTLARHLVLPDHYLRRNPHVAFRDATSYIPDYPDANCLYPVRSTQLFQLSGPPNHVTGACGIGVYRDDLLGKEYTGNLFTCEPVNLVVHRLRLTPKGSTFSGRRASDEKTSEFLASHDTWFRPVQVRTGPDGALWVVDMYRFVIEHPRWIPTEDLARLDVRAGAAMGRIYRIRPGDRPLRKVPRFDRLSTKELVNALDTPNGTQRDLVGQMIRWRNDPRAGPALEALAASPRAESRLHALCLLDGLGLLNPNLVEKAIADRDSTVRRHAVRLAEPLLSKRSSLGEALLKRLADPDAQVRLQLAFTLGEWRNGRAGKALAELAVAHAHDPHLVAAVLSSVNSNNVANILAEVMSRKAPPEALLQKLLGVVAAVGEKETLAEVIGQASRLREGKTRPWQLIALASILDTLDRRKRSLTSLGATAVEDVHAMIERARQLVDEDRASESERLAALGLLGRDPAKRTKDIAIIVKMLTPRHAPALQTGAVVALARIPDEAVARTLLAGWKGYTPVLRGQVFDVLSGRPMWIGPLLQAIEKNDIVAAQIDATRRQRLFLHRDDKVRARAERLFKEPVSADRRKMLEEYASVATMVGKEVQGKAIFVKHCAGCHQLEGVGHEVGPDLSALVNKTPAYLLAEILDPNRNLDSRYLQYLVTTTRGLTYSGLLRSETATSISLRGQDGKEQLLLRADIEDMVSTGKSLMPEGFEKDLSRQDLADLLAYLARQTKPFKRFAGNQPVPIRPKAGQIVLLATTAEIRGATICFEPEFGNVGHWHAENDHVVWTVEIEKELTVDVWLDWSCADAVAGNAFVVEGGKEPLRGKVAGTGGWERYQQKKIGQLTLTPGSRRLTMRPDSPVRGALLDLRGLHLVPPGARPAFRLADREKADPEKLAKQILDDSLPSARRQAIITDHPALAVELVAAMTKDLKPDPKEEYRRIPWIWRVSIAAGRRNDTTTLRKLLEVSLPKRAEPLRDWQAVVLGGGIINGLSLEGIWPGKRMEEMIKDNEDLQKRWKRALSESVTMADNAKVPTGTRYDALRMIALEGLEKRGAQLAKYLAKGTNDELMMGAISGLSDVDSPRVSALLVGVLGHCSESNRKLAIEALLRTEARTDALLDALEAGTVKKAMLVADQQKALRGHKNAKVRQRARKLLGER
jgi:putative membrane-bound dehydrogenase-like protein